MSFRSGPKQVNQNEHLQFPSEDHDQFSFNRADSSPSFQGSPSRKNNRGFQQPVHTNNRERVSRIDETDREASSTGSSGKKSLSDTVIVHVKIGPDVTREIKCELKDDNNAILDRVKKFCRENSLDQQAIPLIINMIKQQFLKIHKKMKENAQNQEIASYSHGEQTPVSPKFNYSAPNAQNDMKENPPADKQQKPKLIGKLDVAIAPSKTKVLKLYSDQFPELVASDFCLENHLPSELVKILSEKLSEIKERYNQKTKQTESQSLPAEIRHTFGKKAPKSNTDDSTEERYRDEISDKQEVQKNLFGGYPERNNDFSTTSSPSFVKQKTGMFPQPNEDVSEERTFSAKSDDTFSMRNTHNDQDDGESVPKMERGREADTAQAYERWANLIKDKNFMKQEAKVVSNNRDRIREDKSADRVIKPLSKPKEAFLIGNPSSKTPRGAERLHTVEDSSSDMGPKLSKDKRDEVLHRLYYNGMASKNLNHEKRDLLKSKKQREEEKELTFHPKISKSPRKVAKPEADHSTSYSREHKDRVSEFESKELRAKQEQFPFKPKISDISTELAVRSRSRSPIHNKLYVEGILQKNHNSKVRDLMFKERHPFSPRLPTDIDNFLAKRPKQNQKEFTNRLVKEGVIREQQMAMRRAVERDDLKDSKTGQPLFQPVVPHDKYYYNLKRKEQENSKTSRSRSTTPQNKEYQSVQVQLEQKSPNLGKTTSPNPLRKVFEKLDSDMDGLISAKKIDLSQVDAQVLEALLDLMDFLENNNATLDYQGFLSVLDKLEIEEQVLKAFNSEYSQNHTIIMRTEPSPVPDLFEFHERPEDSPSYAFPTEGNEDRHQKLLTKIPSKRSDFSTASSNQTENSAQIPKHYRELLNKKFPVKRFN